MNTAKKDTTWYNCQKFTCKPWRQWCSNFDSPLSGTPSFSDSCSSFVWRCISSLKKQRIYYTSALLQNNHTFTVSNPVLQKITRFADPACCTVPKCWTPPTLPFHPSKTPRCINPLVEARWAPAIVGSDRIMGDINGSRSKGPLRTLFPMKFMTVHTFTSKTKTHMIFSFYLYHLWSLSRHPWYIASSTWHFQPKNCQKHHFEKTHWPHMLRSFIDSATVISSKHSPVVDCRSYMITQSAESHLTHSKESIQQTLMLASIYTHMHTYIKI